MNLKLSIILLVFLLARCGTAQETSLEQLIGTWYHSVEEQTNEILVFRPEGIELPRVRGRESMVFTRDQGYIYKQIAPSDGYLEFKGKFQLDEKHNELFVTYQKNEKNYKRKYKVVQIGPDILKLKLLNE